MQITNSTHWDTADLRRVFAPVLAAWNKRHKTMPKRVVPSKRLRIEVTYAKGYWGYRGYAYYNSGRMYLRLPRPEGHGIKQRVQRHETGEELGADGKIWYFSKPIPDSWHVIEKHAVKEIDIGKLAYLFEHELAHCAGYEHSQMAHLNKWSTADSDRYDYVRHLKVGVAKPKQKEKPDQRALRYKRAQEALKRWQSKAKRADTAIRKYRRIIKRYEQK